ncbi:MAG: neutral/alkaline non-lysosomal ceramidase N-terminal domain-containing protein [Victivallaceae bacterium]|nr:neutral/alkaline non-lysosomal ceramidase N-terminal domain-containing protein [Victivallaceae bacterium]
MSEKFMIGWGEADITPDNAKVELAGQYYQRIATGVHSRIKTVACAMRRGDQQAVMVSLDVVSFGEELQLDVRKAVHAAIPEIREESIFLNAIHTHSAPYTRTVALFRDWVGLDKDALSPAEYVPFLQRQIIDAVCAAWSALAPAGIANGFGMARIGHCRRPVFAPGIAEMYGDATRKDFIGMEAGEDSGVELMFTFDAAGKPTGAIVNVPCPSQVMEATYKISSDYMGACRELLKKEFGANFHTMCQVSPAGCQSPRDLVRHFTTEPDFWHEDGVPVHADRLFRAVMQGFASAQEHIDFDPVFKHNMKRITLPVRRASYVEYAKAKEEVAKLVAIMPEREAFFDFCRELHENEKIPGRPGPYDNKEHHFVQIENRKAVIDRYESQDEMPNFSYDMQSFRLGDCAFVNCPFELYLYYGQIVKARSKAFQTFIIQLSGGSCGYLPSPDAGRFGGYGGMIINGKVGSDGGYKLADEMNAAIEALF